MLSGKRKKIKLNSCVQLIHRQTHEITVNKRNFFSVQKKYDHALRVYYLLFNLIEFVQEKQ